ncbi:Tryptophan synthase alpha chain [Candidatus Kinetoplastibacterium sorsogonicusi]|uniref:Tryptophan synthase alpha chain n=1 Tax=Candidatus Kinetoplastidibacterium kentomonadis TaxID=1576550 RepID=A0A3Q8F6R2_9PROT|nr:tryptophan synthase subunit alpha [Candidatus Kinetoplastibacterium sorsogonicusi]AWD32565.1 Tryptophan synthase alpha chain [Candidatus Kinetoplastibacterium sorsogonicusi]
MYNKPDRIKSTFSKIHNKSAALIPYIVAGDPTSSITVDLMHAMVSSGADIIELGIPFSDPMADGKTIQHAMERAIHNNVHLPQVLEYVRLFREKDYNTPIVLMGYANSIERLGQIEFINQASYVGVDGVLIVDYSLEEIKPFASALKEKNIDPIFLLSPTSDEKRIKLISDIAKGYVYYVSLKGVTGAGNININEIYNKLNLIRKYVNIPVGVGFGIKDIETACNISKIADAIVIGSKIIEEMQNSISTTMSLDIKNKMSIDAVKNFIKTIKLAMHAQINSKSSTL